MVRSVSESLSDHCYIQFSVGAVAHDLGRVGVPGSPYPRWDVSRMDEAIFAESVEWACSVGLSAEESADAEGMGPRV